MEMRKEPYAGKNVSLLGFGGMRLPCVGGQSTQIDTAAAQAMVDYAIAHGINYFDTAYPYHGGQSELFLGQALAKYPRDSFFLADKLPAWALKSAGDVKRIFEEQLEKCRVEYFDFYLCHNICTDTLPKFERYGAIEYLLEQKRAGRIRRLGFSFHDTPALLERVAGLAPWDFALIQLNYLDWTLQDAKRQYETLTEHGIPVLVMEPVRGGTLAELNRQAAAPLLSTRPGASLASWALRFAASLPNVLTVLSGMSTMEQLADNVATMEHFEPLTEQEHAMLLHAAEVFRTTATVPCTGCRYCMDCPSGVDIPAVLRANNHYALNRNKMALSEGYGALPPEHRAGACTACGACVAKCPQGIQIPERMAEISTELEAVLAE